MKRRPCWRSEIFFWGLNSIFMQIPPFVSLCKYGFWSQERTHSICTPPKKRFLDPPLAVIVAVVPLLVAVFVVIVVYRQNDLNQGEQRINQCPYPVLKSVNNV